MQIKTRGSKIYLLRSVYNSGTKRCDQKTLGKLEISVTPETVPAEVLEGLTITEKVELERWLQKEAAKKLAAAREESIETAGQQISQLAAALEEIEVDRAKAKEIYAAMDAVAKLLKKQGFKKGAVLGAEK